MTAKPLNQLSGMPQIAAAFYGWQTAITLQRVTQAIVDGFVVDTKSSVTFQGVVQPLTAEELKLKPEGERSWEWMMIHVFSTSLNLQTNDKIIYNSVVYKVMKKLTYDLNNYEQYDIVRDYEHG